MTTTTLGCMCAQTKKTAKKKLVLKMDGQGIPSPVEFDKFVFFPFVCGILFQQ
jgi:hypothetical protein